MKRTKLNLEKQLAQLNNDKNIITNNLHNINDAISETIVHLCQHEHRVNINDAVVIDHNGRRSLATVVAVLEPDTYPSKPFLQVYRAAHGIWSKRLENCKDHWDYVSSKEDLEELRIVIHNEYSEQQRRLML